MRVSVQNLAAKLFSYLLPLGPNYKEITSAPNDPILILNIRPKVPDKCGTTTHESQISLRFVLRSLVFQIMEVYDFSIGYNGDFESFAKKLYIRGPC